MNVNDVNIAEKNSATLKNEHLDHRSLLPAVQFPIRH